jgi:hypothetical protein
VQHGGGAVAGTAVTKGFSYLSPVHCSFKCISPEPRLRKVSRVPRREPSSAGVAAQRAIRVRKRAADHGHARQSWSLDSYGRESTRSTFALVRALETSPEVVVRGGVEPPTFRFSGLRIIVWGWLRRSPCLLSDLACTPIDAGVRGCMRLEMRLSRRSARWVPTPGRAVGVTA